MHFRIIKSAYTRFCRKIAIAEHLRILHQKRITGYAKSCRCNFRRNHAPTVLGPGRIPITLLSYQKCPTKRNDVKLTLHNIHYKKVGKKWACFYSGFLLLCLDPEYEDPPLPLHKSFCSCAICVWVAVSSLTPSDDPQPASEIISIAERINAIFFLMWFIFPYTPLSLFKHCYGFFNMLMPWSL